MPVRPFWGAWVVGLLLIAGSFLGGISAGSRSASSETPEQVLSEFFGAWERGDVQTARALLDRKDRLPDNFGADVLSLRLIRLDRQAGTNPHAVEYRQMQSDLMPFARVAMIRATFDVSFSREGSMNSGRNVYTYFLVKRWPWSPWRLRDWTSRP